MISVLKILTWLCYISSIIAGITLFLFFVYIDINNIYPSIFVTYSLILLLLLFVITFWMSVICAMYDKDWIEKALCSEKDVGYGEALSVTRDSRHEAKLEQGHIQRVSPQIVDTTSSEKQGVDGSAKNIGFNQETGKVEALNRVVVRNREV